MSPTRARKRRRIDNTAEAPRDDSVALIHDIRGFYRPDGDWANARGRDAGTGGRCPSSGSLLLRAAGSRL
ncbi:hypothetical protein PR202_ga22232 [Eleusine coracana subsp. coracana]|uniref:Uncharacterized protein n=1 Tax=Eleusine coracana subsp. coracana TaxID=191504 RepID=A0AAV5D1P4_ELECO|nr:hypothetical protein PR202_ga22232 [Eleusine coracana subsp. coracana]